MRLRSKVSSLAMLAATLLMGAGCMTTPTSRQSEPNPTPEIVPPTYEMVPLEPSTPSSGSGTVDEFNPSISNAGQGD